MTKDLNFGVGVDIEEINRFSSVDRHKSKTFLGKIFTKDEIKYCYARKDFARHLAARFCAKEAAVKALGGLNIHSIHMRDVEIVNSKKGVPCIRIRKNSNNLFDKILLKVSLSHNKNNAIAVVMAIKIADEKKHIKS